MTTATHTEDTMLELTTTYRDATYSAATQEHLRDLLAELTGRPGWNADPRVHALADVVERWDANDATETTFPS